MSLMIVATPIGNSKDVSLRALEVLQAAEWVIGEEFKEVSKFLRQNELGKKNLEVLNEHSTPEELDALVQLCQKHRVALVSDCGTPGFCDPGALLVKSCRQQNIKVSSCPGASSLTTFLSLCGERLDQFLFRGFLPAKTEARQQALKDLKNCPQPVLLMDTPYRLNRLLSDIETHFPKRNCILGVELTTDNEKFFFGNSKQIQKLMGPKKAEFMLLLEAVKK